MMMTQVKAAMMMTTPTQIQMHLCQLLVAKRVIITAAMVTATFVVIEDIGHPDVLIDTKKWYFPSSELDFTEEVDSCSGKSVSKGGLSPPRVGFAASSEARAVIETQGKGNVLNFSSLSIN